MISAIFKINIRKLRRDESRKEQMRNDEIRQEEATWEEWRKDETNEVGDDQRRNKNESGNRKNGAVRRDENRWYLCINRHRGLGQCAHSTQTKQADYKIMCSSSHKHNVLCQVTFCIYSLMKWPTYRIFLRRPLSSFFLPVCFPFISDCLNFLIVCLSLL